MSILEFQHRWLWSRFEFGLVTLGLGFLDSDTIDVAIKDTKYFC
jgi:hypothetical protein